MKRSALLHLVVTPKQKQLMHSPGLRACALKYPAGQTSSGVWPFMTRMVSGTANLVP